MLTAMKAVDLGAEMDWTQENPIEQLGWLFGKGTPWRAEPKIDGVRCSLEINREGGMLLTSRNGLDRSRNFPHLIDGDLLPELSVTILDCELTARWHDGRPMLPSTTALVVSDPANSAVLQEMQGLAVLNVFDVLAVTGEPAVSLEYAVRRELLASLRPMLEATGYMRVVPSWVATRQRCERIMAQGYEGIVFKRASSPYLLTRNRNWLKFKRRAMLDGIVTGYTPGKGQHEGKVGSLEISVYDDRSGTLVKVGSVGNLTDLQRSRASTPAGRLRQSMRGRVVTVIAQGVGNHGHLRSPQLVEFRADKPASECTLDQLDAFPRV